MMETLPFDQSGLIPPVYETFADPNSEVQDCVRHRASIQDGCDGEGRSKSHSEKESYLNESKSCSNGTQSSKTKEDKISPRQIESSLITTQNQDCPDPRWVTKNKHLDNLFSRYKNVIRKCISDINTACALQVDTVKGFIAELQRMLSNAELPRTIILFIGGTGTGKSTLVNALLDRSCFLPTSDDRACTSVAVEVEQSICKGKFEAFVEFLQKNEWFDELKLLLKDMMFHEGSCMFTRPDYSSDMYISYCKVKALYGKIDTFECLSKFESVNQWLGKTHCITCDESEGDKFQNDIEQFIISNLHGPNSQSLWPIIKHVLIKMPNADVCSFGATLVDLPGIGDSNPARNKIAEEFLKDCHSLCIINAMTRAIDDVTSRSLLDQGLRRQLLMDGKLGSLAFVCTMSDRFSEHNAIRSHELQSLCHDLKIQKYSLENEKKIQEQIIKTNRDTECTDKAKAKIWELHENIMKTNYAISKICTRARNEECIRNIQKLYRSIKRQSNRVRDDQDSEESGDESEMDTDEWEENQADAEEAETNIRVFCCSSNEYQKLKGFNHTDGNPLVFDNVEDTQIPALKEYVHELTFSRRLKGLESLVQRLETCVLAFQSLLQNGIILANETRVDIEAQVEEELYQFQGQLHYAIKTLAVDLDELFNGKLRLLFIKGAKNAQMDASMICGKWGPPVNKGANRVHEVGLHWRSYRATVQRRGVFTLQSSKTCINFNHDLVEPIYKAMEHEWNNVFNLQLPQILDHTSEVLKKEMKICMNRLCGLLKCVPISQDEVNTTKIQLELSFSGKISDFLSQTNIEAMRKQREINRMLTPFIQLKMEDVYMNVASQTGKKASKNMRNCMSKGIEKVRKTMYHEAIEMLQGEFGTLQSFILKVIESQVSGLTEEIRKTFEAFWTFTYPSVSDLDSVLSRACADIGDIYAELNL